MGPKVEWISVVGSCTMGLTESAFDMAYELTAINIASFESSGQRPCVRCGTRKPLPTETSEC